MTRRRPSPPDAGRAPRGRRAFFVVVASLLLSSACSTQRTLTIDSDPAGARVWVDGVARGTTPVTIPFVYYGDLDVRLEKEGYRSLAAVVVVPTQIDGYPIVDLPYELTVPRRHFRWAATLAPLAQRATEGEVRATLDRANAFRERTRRLATREALSQPVPGERPPPERARPVEAPPPVVSPRGGHR